jgi:predicted GH43/DUF377 family glycosyl hydrolase
MTQPKTKLFLKKEIISKEFKKRCMERLKVKKEGVLLEKTNLYFENEAVFNPAIIAENGAIHLFYRALSKGDFSTIGYCELDSPMHIKNRSELPILIPQFDYEKKGMEDPRIVKIEDIYYLTYTAFDGINAMGALAISSDLKDFKHWGLITPLMLENDDESTNYERIASSYSSELAIDNNVEFVWDKNVLFFPKKIDGKFYFMHRIKPDILFVIVSDLKEINAAFWEKYLSNLPIYRLDCDSVHLEKALYFGAGCPPLETDRGWIFIYHAAYERDGELVYKAHCILLDQKDPLKIVATLPYCLFEPEYDWEINGNVNNVVFPTGCFQQDDLVYIYYGAADSRIACASFSITELFESFIYLKKENENV